MKLGEANMKLEEADITLMEANMKFGEDDMTLGRANIKLKLRNDRFDLDEDIFSVKPYL